MKKYLKASMEVVEIENTDIVTASGETEEPNTAFSSQSTPGVPGIPGGHGGSGNVGAECCN